MLANGASLTRAAGAAFSSLSVSSRIVLRSSSGLSLVEFGGGFGQVGGGLGQRLFHLLQGHPSSARPKRGEPASYRLGHGQRVAVDATGAGPGAHSQPLAARPRAWRPGATRTLTRCTGSGWIVTSSAVGRHPRSTCTTSASVSLRQLPQRRHHWSASTTRQARTARSGSRRCPQTASPNSSRRQERGNRSAATSSNQRNGLSSGGRATGLPPHRGPSSFCQWSRLRC